MGSPVRLATQSSGPVSVWNASAVNRPGARCVARKRGRPAWAARAAKTTAMGRAQPSWSTSPKSPVGVAGLMACTSPAAATVPSRKAAAKRPACRGSPRAHRDPLPPIRPDRRRSRGRRHHADRGRSDAIAARARDRPRGRDDVRQGFQRLHHRAVISRMHDGLRRMNDPVDARRRAVAVELGEAHRHPSGEPHAGEQFTGRGKNGLRAGFPDRMLFAGRLRRSLAGAAKSTLTSGFARAIHSANTASSAMGSCPAITVSSCRGQAQDRAIRRARSSRSTAFASWRKSTRMCR